MTLSTTLLLGLALGAGPRMPSPAATLRLAARALEDDRLAPALRLFQTAAEGACHEPTAALCRESRDGLARAALRLAEQWLEIGGDAAAADLLAQAIAAAPALVQAHPQRPALAQSLARAGYMAEFADPPDPSRAAELYRLALSMAPAPAPQGMAERGLARVQP